ncbi:MAG: zinc-ribbon domain-containing protein [Candidatus Obscuribacterales bacterium]|jgi:hypothetical protein
MRKREKSKKGNLLIENVIEPARIMSKSFDTVYPEAAKQWAYERNCGFAPSDFSYGSSVKAWFKCPGGPDHYFQSALSTMGHAIRTETWTEGCGFCRGLKVSLTNNLKDKFPALAKQWQTKKNGYRPDLVSYGSSKMAFWKCSKGHTWEAVICNRTTNDTGCPKCNRGAATDLRDYPEALKEFDTKKNKGIDPHALPVGVKVSWRCNVNKTHTWVAGFYRTTKQERCPYCTNKKGSKGNNLKESHPHLAKQWDSTKNGDTKPTSITSGSSTAAWWKCDKGPDHEWQAKVSDRVYYQTGCPFCSLRRTSVTNVLSTQYPKLAKQWHPTKNGKAKPDQERIHSRTKRWWLCPNCKTAYRAEPYRRVVRGSGCLKCAQLNGVKKMLKTQNLKLRSGT